MAVAKKSTTTKSSSRCSAASKYKSNGITITPANFSSGDKIKVTYTAGTSTWLTLPKFTFARANMPGRTF